MALSRGGLPAKGPGDVCADYEVPMTVLNDPALRPLRVVTIGAGMSGIMSVYKIQQQCENVEHVVYDKNPSIGGTWFENRYPGCDTPSHSYTFPWAPNPEWRELWAKAADILSYLKSIVEKLDLGRHIKLNTQVAEARWDEVSGKWKLKLQSVKPKEDWASVEPLEVLDEFEDECDLLLHATGVLNRWDYPSIPGLDTFQGQVVHTAGWPEYLNEKQWKDKRVAVIGSGSSSIQVVPNMQPTVAHMDVFVRNPIWFLETEIFGDDLSYSEEQRSDFRKNPEILVAHMAEKEEWFNKRFISCIMGTPEQKAAMERLKVRTKAHLRQEDLVAGFTPTFPVNCRRITPGDAYLNAVQKSNVSVHFTGVGRISKQGVIGDDGISRECDIIVCATGFDVSYIPRFPVIGRDGLDLREKWKDLPLAYFGLACPDMPNWLTFMGPNWPGAGGSVMGALDANGDYVIKCIHKMQNEHLKSFCPRQDVTDEYNAHTQKWAKKVVFGQNCRSWYKDPKTGHLRTLYPGSSLHYRTLIETPRWEDMEIEHLNEKNRFAFMGIGLHKAQTKEGIEKGMFLSPYINLGRVDQRMLP